MLDALHGNCSLWRHTDWHTRLIRLPSLRKRFDEGHQVGAVLIGQRDPRRHIGISESAHQRIVNILVRWKSTRRRRAAFKRRRHEISRLGIQVWRVGERARWEPILAGPVPAKAVAAPAIPKIQLSASV